MDFKFDYTISVGNVLTAVVLLAGFIRAHRQNLDRLTKIETKLDLIYRWWTKQVGSNGA